MLVALLLLWLGQVAKAAQGTSQEGNWAPEDQEQLQGEVCSGEAEGRRGDGAVVGEGGEG